MAYPMKPRVVRTASNSCHQRTATTNEETRVWETRMYGQRVRRRARGGCGARDGVGNRCTSE